VRIATIFAKISYVANAFVSFFWNLAILFSNSTLGSEKLKQNRHSLIKSRLTDLNNFTRKRVTAKSNDLHHSCLTDSTLYHITRLASNVNVVSKSFSAEKIELIAKAMPKVSLTLPQETISKSNCFFLLSPCK